MFKNNVGSLDRIIRIILGLALIGAFFMFPESPWRMVFLIGIIPLATALISSCPIYTILGLSSCPVKDK